MTRPHTRRANKLLGPCFKTGGWTPARGGAGLNPTLTISFARPSRGAFLSFAVLVRYRSLAIFSLGCRLPPLGLHSQTTRLARPAAAVRPRPHGTVTLCGAPFQGTLGQGVGRARDSSLLGVDSCPFARRYYGNPCWFLFLRLVIGLPPAGDLACTFRVCILFCFCVVLFLRCFRFSRFSLRLRTESPICASVHTSEPVAFEHL